MQAKEMVSFRVDPAVKRVIQDAAKELGQSSTTFITRAALKQAKRKKRPAGKRGAHGGVPTFFACGCAEARNGGMIGYDHPAYHLAIHLDTEIPDHVDWPKWQRELDRLTGFLSDSDDDAVWTWFCEWYPKAMALVPTRRRQQFVKGVYMAYEEGRIH